MEYNKEEDKYAEMKEDKIKRNLKIGIYMYKGSLLATDYNPQLGNLLQMNHYYKTLNNSHKM